MKPILSVTIHDCIVQTYKGSGAGGQHRNKTMSGVRIIHPPSGARAECCEERSQWQNKKTAWRRLANSAAFRVWVAKVTSGAKTEAELLAEIRAELNDPAKTVVEYE